MSTLQRQTSQDPLAAAAKSLQSCPPLHDPIDGSPPGSPVPGILQARTLEWVAIPFSNAWKWKVKVKSLSRVWLSDPMDCSLPGFSVHGIFQARMLEWSAITFSLYRTREIHVSKTHSVVPHFHSNKWTQIKKKKKNVYSPFLGTVFIFHQLKIPELDRFICTTCHKATLKIKGHFC